MIRYTTTGDVRGTCGHSHKTIHTAAKCLLRDVNACSSLGGGSYSDRRVARADGEALEEWELDAVDAVTR